MRSKKPIPISVATNNYRAQPERKSLSSLTNLITNRPYRFHRRLDNKTNEKPSPQSATFDERNCQTDEH